jgi:MOSC domain-containing protein YiiM
MSDIIQQLYLKEKHGQPVTAVNSVIAKSQMGFVGDVSYGRKKRQVLFIERETLDEFNLIPGQIRENVTVKGLKLAGLPEGTQILAGTVLFEVVGDCAPCQFIEGIRPGLEEAMRGRRGTLCLVINDGILQTHDEVSILVGELQTI